MLNIINKNIIKKKKKRGVKFLSYKNVSDFFFLEAKVTRKQQDIFVEL